MKLRVLGCFAALFAACGGSDLVVQSDDQTTLPGLTYEQFLQHVVQEEDTGVFIANGDEMFETEEQLRAYWQEYLSAEFLAIMHRNGVDDKVPTSIRQNITYCVDRNSFGALYNTTVSAMASATGAWEAGANLNFVHVPSQDGNCRKNNNNVWFNVRAVNGGCRYLARAFFPSTSRSGREILVDRCSFNYGNSPSITGVLRHELGHTIGMRHEHTRPEAGACFEDNSWRALTPYDRASVMHYPQCNGTGDWSLNLTNLDRSGAAAAYP